MHKFTIIGQLHERQNHDLIEYINSCFKIYNKAKRKTFHHLKRNNNFNKSLFNTYLQRKYGFLKRTANSVISDAQGVLNALIKSKQYEKYRLECKILSLKKVINELEIKVITNYLIRLLNNKGVIICIVCLRFKKINLLLSHVLITG